MRVAVYPKDYVGKLLEDADDIKKKAAAGEHPVFDSVDEMLSFLESED